MSIENAIINIMENNLDAMRANFSVALSEKAVQKLDERKKEIAENYFGLNEGNPAKEGADAAKKDDEMRKKHMEKYGKLPARLTGKLASKFVARQEKKRKG